MPFPNEKDASNNPPSYADSIRPTPTGPSSAPTPRGQAILDTLTLTRATTINSTIHTAILPAIEAQAARGIPHTVLVLLPSDIKLPPLPEKSEFSFDSSGDAEPVEILGLGSDDEKPKVVRLDGEVNTTAFWRLQVVIEELERGLRDVLNDGRLVPVGREEPVKEGQPAKRRFFGRTAGREGGGGEEGLGKQVEEVGKVLVKVRLEEICLRTVTDFGLYDTTTRQCVIVRVDARG